MTQPNTPEANKSRTRLPENALNAEQSAGSAQRRDNKASAKTR